MESRHMRNRFNAAKNPSTYMKGIAERDQKKRRSKVENKGKEIYLNKPFRTLSSFSAMGSFGRPRSSKRGGSSMVSSEAAESAESSRFRFSCPWPSRSRSRSRCLPLFLFSLSDLLLPSPRLRCRSGERSCSCSGDCSCGFKSNWTFLSVWLTGDGAIGLSIRSGSRDELAKLLMWVGESRNPPRSLCKCACSGSNGALTVSFGPRYLGSGGCCGA
jgi:hypothetical protein